MVRVTPPSKDAHVGRCDAWYRHAGCCSMVVCGVVETSRGTWCTRCQWWLPSHGHRVTCVGRVGTTTPCAVSAPWPIVVSGDDDASGWVKHSPAVPKVAKLAILLRGRQLPFLCKQQHVKHASKTVMMRCVGMVLLSSKQLGSQRHTQSWNTLTTWSKKRG